MIEEAYVSFEVAKLLKEKGFDESCYSYYMTTKTLHTTFHNRVHVEEEPHFNSGDLNGIYDVNESIIEDICSAPTHQMAMAWLREVHNILTVVSITYEKERYDWYICGIKGNPWEKKLFHEEKDITYDTYEEAVEAALKYVLENLV